MRTTTRQPEAADLEAIRRETEARRAHRRLQRIMAAAHGEVERHRLDQRPRRQMGGGMGLPLSMADPYWTRAEASQMMRSPAGGCRVSQGYHRLQAGWLVLRRGRR